MSHALIVGTTECGKTTLARRLAARFKYTHGLGVLVLDPLNDPRWEADFRTADQEAFLSVYWRSQSCAAFLDEGGESVGRYDKAMQKTATRGRHFGHSNYYIVQDPTMIAPVIRAQCRHVFAFAMSVRQAKLLAEEYNCPQLEDCPGLAQGDYIHASRFQPAKMVKGGKFSEPISKNYSRRGSPSVSSAIAGPKQEETGSDGTGENEDGKSAAAR